MKRTFCLLIFAFCASRILLANEVKTVESGVALEQYLGLWNELYRIPNSFQDGASSTKSACYDTTAEYGVAGENKISVTNTCTRKISGKPETDVARAVASVVPGSQGAKLIVNFTGIGLLRWLGVGDGDYWILGLGPVNSDKQYSWALVGNPTRKYGWVLSRKPKLSDAELKRIFQIAEGNGYQRNQFVYLREGSE